MDLPVDLPHHLAFLENIDNENEMLKTLVDRPMDLVIFFEKACADTAWCISHHTIISKILVWATYQFLHGALAMEMAESIQKQVIGHYNLLKDVLPKDIAIAFGGKRYPANSLMFGMSSPVLLSYLREQCIEKKKKILEVRDAETDTLESAIEYIHSGEVEDLWKRDWSVILKILRQAADWEIEGLANYCANIYKRHIHRGNVVKILKMAHRNGWYELKKRCIEFINDLYFGVEFHDVGRDELFMHFHRYSKEAMQVFRDLKDYVTFAGFDPEIIEDSSFTDIITTASALNGISLQNTRHYSERLKDMPEGLEQLDLSMCEWLNEDTFKDIIETCPRLKVLKLNSNGQLDYHSWSQLHLLDNLEHIELSRCHQLSDDDLLVIIRGCPYLRRISIEGCNKLTDTSLVELAIAISTLVSVDFSRTGVTDAAITELAYRNRQLRELKLNRCMSISDHAIQEVVRLAPNLQSLDLTGSSISPDVKNKLKGINRFLENV